MTAAQDEVVLAGVVDKFALRDLVDAYARHADRSHPVGQAAVFAGDGQMRSFGSAPAKDAPVDTLTGREALTAIFTELVGR